MSKTGHERGTVDAPAPGTAGSGQAVQGFPSPRDSADGDTGETIVSPQSNLDVAGAAALDSQLADAVGSVVIDLADVDFVASSGLRIMLKTAQRLRMAGGSLAVRNANDTVREVFRISGFATVVTILD
jgi:anti-sigma B factor antagonist